MGEFSLMHWLIVAVVVMLVFGARRLPEMGASLGKGLREFKRSMSGIGEEGGEEDPALSPPARDTGSVPTRTADSREPKRLSQ